jgi:hypothetical protein
MASGSGCRQLAQRRDRVRHRGRVLIDRGVDLIRVRSYSFLRVEQSAYRGVARVVVSHLTIVFGLLGVAITGTRGDVRAFTYSRPCMR